jgi:hypothetical protein
MTTAAGRATTRSAVRRVTRTSGRLSDAAVARPRTFVRSDDPRCRVGTFVSTGVLVGLAIRVSDVATTWASTGGAGALETVAERASVPATDAAATGSGCATGEAGASDAGGDGSGAAELGAGCSAAGGGAGAGAGEGAGAGGVAGAGEGWGALRDGSRPSGST